MLKKVLKKLTVYILLVLLLGTQQLISLNAPLAHAAETSVSQMTDASFFGVWSSASGKWTTIGKLNYDGFPGLSSIKSNVMQGNYTQAKTELLDYFRNRTTLSALDPDSINRLDIVTKYKNTGNESYANSYINEMMGVIAEGEAGSNDIGSYPKYDQVGLRGNFWMRAYHVFKNSASLSPEENTDLLKTFWKQANFAGGGFYTTGNLSVLAVLGGYSIAIYFPEFAKSSEWMPHFRDNIDYLTSTLALSDGSYEESTDYYVPLSVGWLTDIKRLAVLNNDSLNTAAIDDTNRKLVKYVTDLSYPNGHGVMFGDSHDSDHRPFVSGNANRFNEPTFRHFATLGAQGVSPSYTSTLYPVSKIAIMRSGWLPNDRHLTTNLKQDPQHRHPDDNAITYYAFGRPLLIDPGKYSYSDNPITNWLKTTEAHNTIEVDDLDQNLTEGWFRDWTDNKKFTFVTGNTRSVPGTSHTRETLFLKSSFSIVSDYLQSTGTHKYQQTWHFLPGANLTLDTSSKKVSTKFNDTKGNLQVVPADPLQFTATLDNGYYSPSVSQYQNVQYASYTKSVTGDTYFDTVLYPTPSGETRNVTVERLATTPSVSTTVYSALKINNIGETGTSGYYYISHEDAPRYTRNFDTFAFDGKLAYAEKTSAGKIKSAIIKLGSTLKNNGTNMISSKLVVNDMAVDWNGTNLDINGSNLVVSTSPASYNGIAIYAPGVATVKLNGSVVTNFGVSGNYIYAAGVPSSPVSSGMASYDLGAGNTGVQKMEFDLRPQANNQTSIIGYTGQLTAASTTDELPIQLRLNANGYFQAYNGTAWTSLHTLAYDSTKNYHITMIADLYSQKYNLYIAPYNEQEVQIADDYAFKTGTPQLSDIGTRVTDTVYNDQLHLYNHTIREAEYFEAVVTDDAMVRSGNSSYNNGYAQQLDVGGERATLLRFNLAHISGNVTPEFSKLELTSASSGTYTDQAKLLSSDAWKQSTVTFGNMPTAGQVVASWNTPQANRPIIIDIHSQLMAQWNGDKLLSLIVSSTSNITHQYFSKEQGESRSYPKIKVYTR